MSRTKILDANDWLDAIEKAQDDATAKAEAEAAATAEAARKE